MKHLLIFPLLVLGLVAAWLILTDSIALGAVVLGGVLAMVASRTWIALEVPRTGFRRPLLAISLTLSVLAEIIRSNIAVARIVLFPGKRARRSSFVRIQLDTRNPYSLAALAFIVTATPGTLWVEYDSGSNTMLLHVLDLIDEVEWVEIIKGRYERRLMEIFP